jgi:putative thioredoxin
MAPLGHRQSMTLAHLFHWNQPMTTSFDVTEQTFDLQVVEASRRQPVLVDFWATWCGPCRSLMPLLTRLAEAYGGQFLLAKVEIDQQPGLASRFGVRSVPTVKLVKNGEVVDELMGALPEGAIRAFLDRWIDKESDLQMRAAEELYRSGRVDQALERMRAVLASDPENSANRLRFAAILLQEGRADEAQTLLDSLPADLGMSPEVMALSTRVELVRRVADAPSLATLEARLKDDPKDSEARYLAGVRHLLQGEHREAMEQLLELVRRDRRYGDDAGRKALLQVFAELGDEHPLVVEYRRRLAMAIN